MTKQEYIEYWKSMSADELMVRCGLYFDKIAELEGELRQYETDEKHFEEIASERGLRIAELERKLQEATAWTPVDEPTIIDCDCGCKLSITAHPDSIGFNADVILLPLNYAICKRIDAAGKEGE